MPQLQRSDGRTRPPRWIRLVRWSLVLGTVVVAVIVAQLPPTSGPRPWWLVGLSGYATAASLLLGTVIEAIRHPGRPEGAESTPDQVRRAQQKLAELVQKDWNKETSDRLLNKPGPMPVRWKPASEVADYEHFIGQAISGRSDQIDQLANGFRALKRRRLVILGGPGAGKTILAAQLLLELLESPEADDEAVPVLLPLAGWNTNDHPELHDWLAIRLGETYQILRTDTDTYGASACGALAEQGKARVLPILDGLDELTEDARISVLTTLNSSLTETDQLILISRGTEYAKMVEVAGDVLTAAAVIEPDPLTPADAAQYLNDCMRPRPDDQWQPVLDALRAGTPSPLASALSTPLGLWLLRTIYITPRPADRPSPAPLLDPATFPNEGAVKAHLFQRLIPALIRTAADRGSRAPNQPSRRRRAWKPENMGRWLGYLAHHLQPRPLDHTNPRDDAKARDQAKPGDDAESQVDAEPWDFAWWHLARHALTSRAIRLTLGLVFGLAVALTVGFGSAGGLTSGLVVGLGGGLGGGFAGGFTVGLGGGIAYWLAFAGGSARWLDDHDGFMEVKIRETLGHHLVGGLTVGLAFGLAGGIVAGFLFGRTAGITLGLTAGLTFGLVGEVVPRLIRLAERHAMASSASTPRSTLRADRRLTLLATCVVGLTFGLTFGIVAGLTFALVSLLAGGLAGQDSHAWVVYVLAATRLAMAGHLPYRLMPFLDDAHRLGLLRADGPRYQFRHIELQRHLADNYRPSLPGGSVIHQVSP